MQNMVQKADFSHDVGSYDKFTKQLNMLIKQKGRLMSKRGFRESSVLLAEIVKKC